MPQQKVSEVRRASRQDDAVGLKFCIVGGQGDVAKVRAGPELLEGERDVGTVVVPPQAVFVRRAHRVLTKSGHKLNYSSSILKFNFYQSAE